MPATMIQAKVMHPRTGQWGDAAFVDPHLFHENPQAAERLATARLQKQGLVVLAIASKPLALKGQQAGSLHEATHRKRLHVYAVGVAAWALMLWGVMTVVVTVYEKIRQVNVQLDAPYLGRSENITYGALLDLGLYKHLAIGAVLFALGASLRWWIKGWVARHDQTAPNVVWASTVFDGLPEALNSETAAVAEPSGN